MVDYSQQRHYDIGITGVTMTWRENLIEVTLSNPKAVPGIVAIFDRTFKELSMGR